MKSIIKYYPWFYCPNAVHKMLIHSTQVMEVLDLPLGWYSEEPLESNNKTIKNFRENKTRKTSRKVTMLDLMIRLQCNSDPIISSMRHESQSKYSHYQSLPIEVKNLLDVIDSDADDEIDET